MSLRASPSEIPFLTDFQSEIRFSPTSSTTLICLPRSFRLSIDFIFTRHIWSLAKHEVSTISKIWTRAPRLFRVASCTRRVIKGRKLPCRTHFQYGGHELFTHPSGNGTFYWRSDNVLRLRDKHNDWRQINNSKVKFCNKRNEQLPDSRSPFRERQ